MRWAEFAAASPELAKLCEERLLGPGVALLGTLRADGSPRISPCEVYVVDGELLLGMMWRSRKANDLHRDPRIAVHSIVIAKDDTAGDVKLYGRIRDIDDPGLRERYADVVEEAIAWRPKDPYHLFAVDIEQSGGISFGEGARAIRWPPERGEEPIPHPDAGET